LGNTTSYSSPKQVGALTNWSYISAGKNFCLAIKTDGTLWGWGVNGLGQLGLGNTTYYSSPKQVGALTNWLLVSASQYQHTAAIKTDGTLWTWGSGAGGGLGVGNTTNYSSPKQVGALTTWKYVSTGVSSTFAIKTDGTLWVWGRNNLGQLGLNNITYYSSPKQLGALTNWKVVAGSISVFTGAVKTDGTLWTWGNNANGALGLGNTTRYSSPKQVGALTNWLNLAAGYYNVLSTKTDGTLWSWGRNNLGQLGLGNISDYSSPMQVGLLTTWKSVAIGSRASIGLLY
jgi:alpha-tubulin suppressor-like RCC1 family protein